MIADKYDDETALRRRGSVLGVATISTGAPIRSHRSSTSDRVAR